MEEKKELVIEIIAWHVFQNKLNLNFKNDISFEERKKITDVPEYQQYRDIAVKIYEKKQRALLNKKYRVIDIPADGKSGMMGGAYTLCFVYSKHKGNFVLRGYMREVEEYLKKNYTHYFYNMSLWSQGFHRDIWRFWKDDIGVFIASNRDRKKGRKTEVRPYWHDEIDDFTFKFKRLPKRWIPEFDKL